MTSETDDLVLVLSRAVPGNRVKVSLESYLLFNSQIDHELQALVARWSDFMTNHSQRAGSAKR